MDDWSIEEVCQFIRTVDARDAKYHDYANLFQQHVSFTAIRNNQTTQNLLIDKFSPFCTEKEIDGKALKLLDTEKMVHYMDLRLGPALKIANKVKEFIHDQRRNSNNF